jgi:tetratricopeptide (TPR) repeat protein
MRNRRLADVHYMLGEIARIERAFPRSADAYLTALAFHPDLLRARVRLGEVLIAMGEFDEAKNHLRQALQLAQRQGQQQLAAQIQSQLDRLNESRP